MRTSIYSRLILSCLVLLASSVAKAQTIKDLFFPYAHGYEFTMTDTTIKYDQYSFPVKTTIQDIVYKVSVNSDKPDILVFNVDIIDKETEKTLNTFISPLRLNKKGMSWGFDKKDENGKKQKETFAIKLPLSPGSKWKSSFGGQNAVMTCITTDTILPTIYGNIHCFGISYTVIYDDKPEYKYYGITKEFYNIYAGKVHTEDVVFLYNKLNQTEKLMAKSIGNISYSNLTPEQKALIK